MNWPILSRFVLVIHLAGLILLTGSLFRLNYYLHSPHISATVRAALERPGIDMEVIGLAGFAGSLAFYFRGRYFWSVLASAIAILYMFLGQGVG